MQTLNAKEIKLPVNRKTDKFNRQLIFNKITKETQMANNYFKSAQIPSQLLWDAPPDHNQNGSHQQMWQPIQVWMWREMNP